MVRGVDRGSGRAESAAWPAWLHPRLWSAKGVKAGGFCESGRLSSAISADLQRIQSSRLRVRTGRRRGGRTGVWPALFCKREIAAGFRFVRPKDATRAAIARGGFGHHRRRRDRSLDGDGQGNGADRGGLSQTENSVHRFGGNSRAKAAGKWKIVHAATGIDGIDRCRRCKKSRCILAGTSCRKNRAGVEELLKSQQ